MKSNAVNRGVNILKSIVLSFILTLLLILIMSILLTFTPLKEDFIPMFNTVIMIVSITVGSIHMALKVKEKGWLNGGIIGILYFLILLLINFLFVKPFIFDVFTVGKLIICLVAGAIGGMIGVNIK